MPSLREELDALFGPSEPFSPEGDGSFGIDMPTRSELPSVSAEGEIQAPTAETKTAEHVLGKLKRAPSSDGGFGSLLGAGTVSVGEMALGIPEYVARQTAGAPGTARHEALTDVAGGIESARGGLTEIQEGIMRGVSPELADMVGREILTLDPEKTIWQGGPVDVGTAIAAKFVQSLPATIAVMLPAARMFKAGATKGALTYLGASEGGLSLGGIQNNIAEEINGMGHTELLQESELYGRIYSEVGDEAAARTEFIRKAQGAAPVVGGAMVAAVSMSAGRFLEPVFKSGAGMGLGKRMGTGFLAEAPQEGAQGAVEQFVQNFAAQAYDRDRQLSEGVAEAAVQEGLIGGLTGAAFTGVAGQRPERPLPPPTVDEGGQMGIPGIGQQLAPDAVPEPEAPVTFAPGVIYNEQQQDLFPTSDSTEGVLVPPPAESPTGVTEQGVLPMTLRERGRPTLQETPRGARIPTQVPTDVEPEPVPAADPVGEQPAIADRVDDLFASMPKPQALTGAQQRQRTEGFVTRLFDDQNNVIDEQLFETQEEADALADEYKNDPELADANITVQPLRTTLPPEKAGVTTVEQAQPAAKEVPAEAPEAETAEHLRRTLSFEEREEVAVEAKGARTPTQVADRLISKAAAQEDVERRRRIGGFVEPDRLQFNSPEREQEYREGWQELLDAELTMEMTSQKQARERAEKRRTAAYKKLGLARQLDRSTQLPSAAERTIALATKVDKSTVSTLQETVSKQAKEVDTTPADVDYIGELADMSRDKIDALEGVELEQVAEQAILARAARNASLEFPVERERYKPLTPDEVATNEKLTLAEYRAQYDTPGKKKKLIRREIANLQRIASEQASVKATKVTKTAKTPRGTKQPRAATTFETEALTIDKRGQDESVEKRVTRKAKAKKVYAALRATVKKADRFANRFDTTGDFGTVTNTEVDADGKMSKRGRDFLYGKMYYTQLVQFAKSLIETGHESNDAINIAAGLDKMLGALDDISVDNFIDQWTKLARANEFENLSQIPDSAIKGLRDPVTREKATKKTNSKVLNHARNVRRMEELWANDPIWQELVAPVIRKFSEVIQRNLDSRSSEAYYNPTAQEVEGLRMALRAYRKTPDPKYQDEFYKPLLKTLKGLGFEVDTKGELISEFHPSGDLLSPSTAPASTGVREVSFPTETTALAAPTPEGAAADRAVVEDQHAVLNIRRANALIEKFKDMVAPSKTTLAGIKRQEQRLIRGLRKIGVWTDISPGLGRISIGGYRSKTYRLVGPRLNSRALDKSGAKSFISKLSTFTMPRELAAMARSTEASTAPGIEALVDENATELFLEAVNLEDTAPELDRAASVMGDLLADRYSRVDANTVLDTIIENLPEGHFYQLLAKKLRSMNMAGMTLQYDWTGSKFSGRDSGALGKFDPTDARAYLNRDVLGGFSSDLRGARAVHTTLHEFLHGATQYALDMNPDLADFMFDLRAEAVRAWAQQYGPNNVPIGLRMKTKAGAAPPIDEFVVEVFADQELQDFLRTVPVRKTTVWDEILTFLKRILDMEDTALSTNLLDVFMQAEEFIFEDAGRVHKGQAVLKLDLYDDQLRPTAQKVWDKVTQSNGIWQRISEGAKHGVRYLMSQEQLRDTYTKYFTDGSFGRYMDAFFKRNARNAELMTLPESISRLWTKVEESDAVNGTNHALEISRVGTEATLHRVAADKPITDAANAHITEPAAQARHADLHARYNALSPEAKQAWDKTQAYYKESVVRESLYLMQSALRGILTKGKGTNLTLAQFDEKFSIDTLRGIESREDLAKMLEPYVPEDGRDGMIETLHRMSTVPRQHKGNYFPSMRYGDEVVYAEKKREKQIFEDRKEAWGVRAALADADPTLDVSVYQDGGAWVVQVVEREFVMAETKTEIEEAHARLVEEYGADSVGDPQLKVSKQMDSNIKSNAALRAILESLEGNPAAQAAIKNFYLRNLADASFRKHEVNRKNRRGVDYDLQHRNLANYAKQSSYYTAQLQYGWQMSEALDNMFAFIKDRHAAGLGPELARMTTRELSDVYKQVKYRDEMSADPLKIQTAIRKGVELTHFMMLTSPSYWAINATQPWFVSAPMMAARHGYGQTLAAMGVAQKLIKDPLMTQAKETKGGLAVLWDPAVTEDAFDVIHQLEEHIEAHDAAHADEYKTLLETLRQNHIIDINVFTEMREIATGKKPTAYARIIDSSRIMAHLTEVNNRVLVALSAYRLEYNMQIDQGASVDAAVEAATKYAGDMVSQTQFNYSSANKPPLFQSSGPLGAVAPLMFQFMQWPQHMYALLIRNFHGAVGKGAMSKAEARKALLGLFATHAAVGGMVGMALQPIKWAFGMVMMAFGDEDEPYTFASAISGRTFDRAVTSVASDAFGTDIGAVVSKGLPMAFGADLSARMSMGTLYFVDLRGDTAESALGSLVASFGGATLNQAINWSRGLGKVGQGDLYRGVEQMMPKIARDAMRSVRYYNEGLVNNAGDTVIRAKDMPTNQVVSQFFGFSPETVSQFYTAQTAIKDAEAHAKERKKALVRRFRNATGAERTALLRDVAEFNRGNPAERITRSTLVSGTTSKYEREARYRRYGANVDERKAKFYQKYSDPYRE